LNEQRKQFFFNPRGDLEFFCWVFLQNNKIVRGSCGSGTQKNPKQFFKKIIQEICEIILHFPQASRTIFSIQRPISEKYHAKWVNQ
jgi:hypothetical protein